MNVDLFVFKTDLQHTSSLCIHGQWFPGLLFYYRTLLVGSRKCNLPYTNLILKMSEVREVTFAQFLMHAL